MDRFTARRKLLRGSLSAPLVLTVASPSVLANSSFIACTDRNEGLDTTAYKTARDNVFRVQVDVYQILPRSGWNDDTRFELIGGRYYRIDQPDTVGIVPGTGSTITKDTTPRHKIVWFNQYGNEVGSGWLNPSSGEAVSCSCMCSFNGTGC